MREIKFRGKRIDNGEWVCGYLAGEDLINVWNWRKNGEEGEVITYQVDPETIGQYTGLKDKNGKEIYEGDIFYHQQFRDKKDFGVIFWREGRYWVNWKIAINGIKDNNQQVIGWGKPKYGLGEFPLDVERCQNYEVIGNIYDNPNLLEVKK